MAYAIDHGLGRAVLHGFAIDLEPHAKVLRVGNFVLRHQPWAGRAERVAGFALGPLTGALDLESTFRDVVQRAVARDVIKRIIFRNIFRGLADNDAEFDFPVGLFPNRAG